MTSKILITVAVPVSTISALSIRQAATVTIEATVCTTGGCWNSISFTVPLNELASLGEIPVSYLFITSTTGVDIDMIQCKWSADNADDPTTFTYGVPARLSTNTFPINGMYCSDDFGSGSSASNTSPSASGSTTIPVATGSSASSEGSPVATPSANSSGSASTATSTSLSGTGTMSAAHITVLSSAPTEPASESASSTASPTAAAGHVEAVQGLALMAVLAAGIAVA